MLKSCSRCGKIHDKNQQCPKIVIYRGGEERKLRASRRWTEKSLDIRERTHHLCEVCLQQGVYTYKGTEVHHIEKLKDRPDLLLEDSNLICLCQQHHEQADRGILDKDYLKSLAMGRDSKSPTNF